MQTNSNQFFIGESVMLELEMLLSIICGCYPAEALTSPLTETIAAIPKQLKDDFQQLLGHRHHLFSFLEFASTLGEVLLDDNYERASLAIRSLSLDDALYRLEQRIGSLGLESHSTDTSAKLEELLVQSQIKLYQILGKTLVDPGEKETALLAETKLALRILRSGDLNTRFWLALDQLYYQYWEPFRKTQRAKLQIVKTAIRQSLTFGNTEDLIQTLPPQNPLKLEPTLLEHAQKHGLKVFFWSEPIGLPDAWFVTPEVLGVSFANPGKIIETLRKIAERITLRTAALSDPTRLIILRLIREFGMNNTEIAGFLGIARPTVSNHAKILREAGLITTHVEGGAAYHHQERNALTDLFEELAQFLGYN